MTTKKTDYIIIYSFLCASILSIAVLARMFAVTELKMDEFSALMVFFVTCLFLVASILVSNPLFFNKLAANGNS